MRFSVLLPAPPMPTTAIRGNITAGNGKKSLCGKGVGALPLGRRIAFPAMVGVAEVMEMSRSAIATSLLVGCFPSHYTGVAKYRSEGNLGYAAERQLGSLYHHLIFIFLRHNFEQSHDHFGIKLLAAFFAHQAECILP